MKLKRLFVNTSRALGIQIQRYHAKYRSGCASLTPEGTPRGAVLIAYILDPFLRKKHETISTAHTHHWESFLMAEVWRDLGFSVDVIDYRNDEFFPSKRYDFFVSARTQFAILASRLAPDCVKIAHFDTSHFAFNNFATYQRLRDAQARRGVSLPNSTRHIEHNVALEIADYGVVLGNEMTVDSYRYTEKPLFALSAPTATDLSWNDEKDFDACKNCFLWFGSGGLVHKGLDLVLEAFAEMPEVSLIVCGPIELEKSFCNVYRKELYETRNIRLAGWVDVNGDLFRNIVSQCAAIVYPSCAEGQATSVLNCMRAGLIPILTPETGIPVGDFGISLMDASTASIKNAVRHLVSLPCEDLANRARRTWEHATVYHSHDAYKKQYREIISRIATHCGK
jgi:glycosyltransferase involved in cell wall biosynthesis